MYIYTNLGLVDEVIVALLDLHKNWIDWWCIHRKNDRNNYSSSKVKKMYEERKGPQHVYFKMYFYLKDFKMFIWLSHVITC